MGLDAESQDLTERIRQLRKQRKLEKAAEEGQTVTKVIDVSKLQAAVPGRPVQS